MASPPLSDPSQIVQINVRWSSGDCYPKSITVSGPMIAAGNALGLLKPGINQSLIETWISKAWEHAVSYYKDKQYGAEIYLKEDLLEDGYIEVKIKPEAHCHELLKYMNTLKQCGWTLMGITSAPSVGGSNVEKHYWCTPDDTPPPYHLVKNKTT